VKAPVPAVPEPPRDVVELAEGEHEAGHEESHVRRAQDEATRPVVEQTPQACQEVLRIRQVSIASSSRMTSNSSHRSAAPLQALLNEPDAIRQRLGDRLRHQRHVAASLDERLDTSAEPAPGRARTLWSADRPCGCDGEAVRARIAELGLGARGSQSLSEAALVEQAPDVERVLQADLTQFHA